jgi:membrane protein implicated in regulation of membrane protease activity
VAAVIVVLLLLVTVLVLLRLRARRRRRERPVSRRAPAPSALVGRTALVLERIANDEGVGCVGIDGQVWTARAFDGEQRIAAGEEVEVVEIRGATALVAQ